MVTNSINLTINETYDLNTKVDKVTLLAIRTPSYDTVARYVSPRNWSKIKFNRASFRLACASQLPVDPLGVGFEAGQISPQELINPILFKTVTGDSLGPILDVIYGKNNATHDNGDSLKDLEVDKVVTFHTPSIGDDLAEHPMQMYYTLLGDTSFRQAHPQVGISAANIVPLVREVYSTMPLANTENKRVGVVGYNSLNNEYKVGQFSDGTVYADPGYHFEDASGRIISGRTVPMPAIDTLPGPKSYTANTGYSWPMSYCAICIMPPSVQRSLYYRCIVSWNITLSGFVPAYQQDAFFGTKSDHIYNDWTDRPVSEAVAAANELWDDNGLIVTDGMENVAKVTQTVT